ncbi:small GTP-binding protein [Histomonas meleagridis]|uniref:small GTP-binding protein n=1 Tax=Histomonas meleagridis TaxID=135588 RepID=UPI00355A4192|nr:small GTP-binding protein [Histomonas meleagridis]KAH0798860.1 small GTP-binding protein [Histomonas meleagridis]
MKKVKAVLIGNSGVGKTSIFQRVDTGEYSDDHVLTVGGAYAKVTKTTKNGQEIDIGLWDTAGQERFRNVIPMYFQRASFILVIYDVSDQESFDALPGWIDIAKEKAPADAKVLIVGNKCDLENTRVIDFTQAQNFGMKVGAVLTLEVSAKTQFGLDVLFQEIANLSEESSENKQEVEEDVKLEPADPNERKNKGNDNTRTRQQCC